LTGLKDSRQTLICALERVAAGGAEEHILNLVRALALLGAISPAFAQYAGPAILLRGEAPGAMQGAAIDFRPFLELTGSYDAGLSGVTVNSQGNPVNDKAFGMQVTGGVSGTHSWKHISLGLDYRASVRHNPSISFYDGTDQTLSLGLTDRLSRHTTFTLRESAGLFSNNFSSLGLSQAVPFDPAAANIPRNDFFDNRTMYLSTQADFTIQKSARLSLDFGADGFLQRRRSSALYGVTGGGARTDLQYRLTRRSTIGAGYTYTHYSFTGIFSSTDLHGVVASYGLRVSRNFEFSGYGGVLRAETKFQQNVPLDPAVAAIIGVAVASEVTYRIDYVPNLAGRLSYTVQRGVFYISGGHTVLPGNGLFLTSTTTNVGMGYMYTGLKRWSIHAAAGYNRSNSIGNVTGDYGGYQGSLAASRSLFRYTHGVISANFNKYNSGVFTNYNRWTYSIRLGLGFTPGDIPLRLW
jgi:hypothetical protein